MRALVVVGCVLGAATAPSGRAVAAEHVFVADGATARLRCGDAPSGWQRPELDDRDWSVRATLVGRRDGGAPYELEAPAESPAASGEASAPASAHGDGDGGSGSSGGGATPPSCAGARFARWHFSVGAELKTLKTLTLRIRYTHGFAAYLNGIEVARRRLDSAAPVDALATDVHGPEYESFTVAPATLRRGDNVLAVEVHPHTAGRDTTVELSLRGDEGARFVRGPYLAGLREREVTIVFDTTVPTAAEVRWGRDEGYGQVARDALGEASRRSPARPRAGHRLPLPRRHRRRARLRRRRLPHAARRRAPAALRRLRRRALRP